MQKNNIINLANFTPAGELGQLFAQARAYNQINLELKKILPEQINSLELCLIKSGTATFIANNQALGFRAKQQQALLLKALMDLKISQGLEQINKIEIKISLKDLH
ncbi:MAG: hypothetical protein HAW58_07050 [Candidatus Thioglobus sp.]|nr:hypothetical protein [Candidatus Thioglobus sp.]